MEEFFMVMGRKMVLFLLMVGLSAVAQEPVTPAPASPTSAVASSGLRWSAGLLYSMADEIDADISITGIGSGSGGFSTSAQLGVVGSLFQRVKGRAGFELGLSYEMDRKIKSGSGVFAAVDFSSGPKISIMTLFVSGNFSLDNGLFFLAGIHMPKIEEKRFEDVKDLEGELGYQLGLGYELEYRLILQLEQRFLKATARLDDGAGLGGSLDPIKLDGLIFSAKYAFN